jgi:peptidoglycan-N-acetylmuramic acid deacetylase
MIWKGGACLKLQASCIAIAALTAFTLLAAGCSEDAGTAQPSSTASAVSSPSLKPSISPAPSTTAASSPEASLAPSASPSVQPSFLPSLSPSPSAATVKPTATPQAAKGDASRTALSWYYMKKKDGQVPGFPNDLKQLKPNQKVAWVGTGKKVYLTFDTGGPIGESDKLLEILKDNDVKVTFFLVGYNVKEYKEFAKKVSEEGHLIGNHTMTHKDMTEMSDEAVIKELDDFAALIQEVTGKPVAPLFRFPYGKYSMHLLDLVSEKGYTSVFWSTAMRDWEPRAGGAEDSYKDIMNGLHEGNVILMHQGSQDNIDALDRIIKDVKKAGYEFASLGELMQ